MSITATTAILGTLTGSPVAFLPVPTPWPAELGCENYIYRQAPDHGSHIIAWDPIYSRGLGDEAHSCVPPQMASWWFQATNAVISTALGPTFVCPQAFSAVHTLLRTGTAQETIQSIFCCPSNYGLYSIRTEAPQYPFQCTSMANLGVTLSYLTITQSIVTATAVSGSLTSPITSTTSLNLHTTSVVAASAATVYAVPVNGINVLERAIETTAPEDVIAGAPTSSTGVQKPSASGSTLPQSPLGVSPGAIAAAVIASVLSLLFLSALGYILLRRRRQARTKVLQHQHDTEEESDMDNYPVLHGVVCEAPTGLQMLELPHGRLAHEMLVERQTHEMPTSLEIKELPALPRVYELPSRRSHMI